MAHDVFISYSSKDKAIADAICATMEQAGVRCWIAPRDILPGMNWGASIVQAISGARVFVLVFSASANKSEQISREVERAVHAGLPVIPYRIEDVVPAESLEYFLSTPHWLDAVSPPMERHAQYLTEVVKQLLADPSGSESHPAPSPPAHRPPALAGLLRPLPLAGLAAAILAAAALAFFCFGRPPSPVGSWKSASMQWAPSVAADYNPVTLGQLFGAVLTASRTTGTFDLNGSGGFQTVITVADQGTVQRDGSGLTFTSSANRVSADVGVQTLANATAVGGQPGEAAIVLQGYGRLPEPWVGQPDPAAAGGPLAGVAGTWRNGAWGATPDGQVWTGALTITAQGGYTVQINQHIGGIWAAKDGKWSTTVAVPGSTASIPGAGGSYRFDGANQLTTTADQGTTVWIRTK